jgi:hypothetical protein
MTKDSDAPTIDRRSVLSATAAAPTLAGAPLAGSKESSPAQRSVRRAINAGVPVRSEPGY